MTPLLIVRFDPGLTPAQNLMAYSPQRLDQEQFSQLALDTARSIHLGALLHRALQMFNSDIYGALQESEVGSLKRNHFHLLLNMDIDGTRISHLAERSGLTKQTVGTLAHEMEALKFVILKTDPADGRAKLVAPSKAGIRFLFAGITATRSVTDRYTQKVSQRRMSQLHSTLAMLLDTSAEDSQ